MKTINVIIVVFICFINAHSQNSLKWKNFNYKNSPMENNFDWVSSFHETNSNDILIGTGNKASGFRGCGLFLFQNNSVKEIANIDIIRGSYDIVKDNNGDLLIADAMGVFIFSEDSLSNYNHYNAVIPINTYSAIEKGDGGKLYLGTWYEELVILDENSTITFDMSNSILENPIYYDLLFHNDILFIGTSYGLYKFENNQIVKFEDSPRYISCLTLDTNGDIWIGDYLHGIKILRNGVFIDIELPYPDNEVWSIVIDSKRNKWIGTRGKGLLKYDFSLGTVTTILDTINSEIASNSIQTLFIDSKDNLWIGTFDNGFSIYNEEGIISDIKTEIFPEYKNIKLAQNYPNPFNPTTTISYSIPASGKVSLKVYDVLGKQMATLTDDFKNAGKYSVNFNARNYPSGVYYYKIHVGATNGSAINFEQSKKMLLIK